MALDYDFEASVYVVVFYYVAKAVHYVVMHIQNWTQERLVCAVKLFSDAWTFK